MLLTSLIWNLILLVSIRWGETNADTLFKPRSSAHVVYFISCLFLGFCVLTLVLINLAQ